MQKGSWVWWLPSEADRPKWMIPSQNKTACVVEKVDEKTGMVSIVGLTPARQQWAKVVPMVEVLARGG